jgi:hypothetical protein
MLSSFEKKKTPKREGGGGTNPRRQFAFSTNVYKLAPNILWVHSMWHASCHVSRAYNFEVDPRFFGNLCIPAFS